MGLEENRINRFKWAEIAAMFSAKKPALIVSLTGSNLRELETQYRQLSSEVDIIEWRVDKVLKQATLSELGDIVKSLGKIIKQPILATVRTASEGGDILLEPKEYLQLIDYLAQAPEIAIIDLEMNEQNPARELNTRAKMLKQRNITSIFSKHFFQPKQADAQLQQGLAKILDEAFAQGADIAKLAIWIDNSGDLLELFKQTHTYHERYPERKILIIGMGKAGQSSRLIGGVFGSCATFAAPNGVSTFSSAPGQLPAGIVFQVLQLLHGKMRPFE